MPYQGKVRQTVTPTDKTSTFGRMVMERLTDTFLVEAEGTASEHGN